MGHSVLDCFIPSCGRWWKWVTLDHPSVRWCSQLHLISSLAVPGVSKSWSGVKESVACVAGEVIVPGVLSWRRTFHLKRVKGENPSLTCSKSSRSFAAKELQHSRLNRQLRKLRRGVSLRSSSCRSLLFLLSLSHHFMNSAPYVL